jgi:DNA-directed RNA polymerase specialized sigma24 family protein
MTRASNLNQAEFDQFLKWLDTEPDRAGQRYEAIRHRLIQVFLNRQCAEAEDLADDTINRVAKRVPDLQLVPAADRERYFYGVAKNVAREFFRARARKSQPPPEPASAAELEPYLKCLDECLGKLPRKNAKLILEYYEEQKRAKIKSHEEMRDKLRLKAGALRARVFRIRLRLEACLRECLERALDSNDIDTVGI